MNKIAFIVEGTKREPSIIKNMGNIFFRNTQVMEIILPAGQNIYMLWKILNEDDFQTDIIEVLKEQSNKIADILGDLSRDDFAEVYLFFDYDGHQNNLHDQERNTDVIEKMLQSFDNETETGKLYISYPMIEALRDFKSDTCACHTSCYWEIAKSDIYKNLSSGFVQSDRLGQYDIDQWQVILNHFAKRVSCMFDKEKMVSFEEYRKEMDAYSIYQVQKIYIKQGQVFVLSAIPEFLLDYHRIAFWHRFIKKNLLTPGNCEKQA